MAEAIAELIADARLRHNLSEAAARTFMERFHIDACDAALDKIVRRTVAEFKAA